MNIRKFPFHRYDLARYSCSNTLTSPLEVQSNVMKCWSVSKRTDARLRDRRNGLMIELISNNHKYFINESWLSTFIIEFKFPKVNVKNNGIEMSNKSFKTQICTHISIISIKKQTYVCLISKTFKILPLSFSFVSISELK